MESAVVDPQLEQSQVLVPVDDRESFDRTGCVRRDPRHVCPGRDIDAEARVTVVVLATPTRVRELRPGFLRPWPGTRADVLQQS
ncbi:hypothetical protein JCM11754A_36790 [Isoptericola variabilis]